MKQSFIESIFHTVDDIAFGFNQMLGQPADNFCQLETSNDQFTLVAKDGSLVSIIEINGSLQMQGNEEFQLANERFLHEISPRLTSAGQSFQLVMHYDKEDADYEISKSFNPIEITAKNLGLDMTDMLEDWKETITQYCSSEQIWVCLWTRPFILSKSEEKSAQKNKQKKAAGTPNANAQGYQSINKEIDEIKEDHRAFKDNMLIALKDMGVIATVCDVHEVIKVARRSIETGFTSRDWKPVLPGDKITLKIPDSGEPAQTSYLYPSIGSQVFPRNVENVSTRILRTGDSWHGTVSMVLAPQIIKPFSVLFRMLLDAKIPWKCSFFIEGGGLEGLGLKKILSSILRITSNTNKQLEMAIDQLEQAELNGSNIVKFRLVFGTSIHNETNEDIAVQKISSQISSLASTLQSWGSMEVTDIIGDPLLGLNAVIPALMPSSPGNAIAAPIESIIPMFPFSRPASVWKEGSVILRTPDGKPMPFAQGSSEQAAWIDLGVSPMGGGKSVWLNTINFGFIFQAGLTRLPWLSILDVGPSSEGLINLIKEGLPDHLKHKAAYHRLKMDADYSINPCDTPLCATKPIPSHASFLTNLFALFATELSAEAPQDGITGIARACIDAAFDELSPERNPKIYSKGVNHEVDELIEEINYQYDSHTSWWDIVEVCFKANKLHEAISAQRFAMPLLADIASMARRDMVTGIYTHNTAGGERITDFFWRSCMETIKSYPILRSPTKFDIGDAQIVSLDLDEVCPKGGADADRQTGVMYMLARQVIAGKFFMMPTDVKYMPKFARQYHAERIEHIRRDPKRLCFDELHRVVRSSSVSKQIIGDIETSARESRKWNLSIGLYSQSIDDFPDIMVELATSIFILGVGHPKMADNLVERFGLNNAARNTLLNLSQPNKKGANMLAIFKTAKGRAFHLLTNTIGMQALWAFSSTSEDVDVRNALYKKIGITETLKLLSKKYPGGVKKEIDHRKSKVNEFQLTDENSDVINELIDELTDYFFKK